MQAIRPTYTLYPEMKTCVIINATSRIEIMKVGMNTYTGITKKDTLRIRVVGVIY